MGWYRSSFLDAVFTWLWRSALFVWRFLRGVWLGALAQVPTMSLGRQEEGRGGEAGGQSAEPGALGGDPPEGIREKWGQGVAPAAFDGQGRERKKEEEEEEEEDDFSGKEYRVPKTDEFYCEYDSTWEVEESGARNWFGSGFTNWNLQSNFQFQSFKRAAKDLHKFRQDCHNQDHVQHMTSRGYHAMPNLDFYLGKSPSKPDGVFIWDFHSRWRHQYERLEYVHTFIQWLFPLQEPGMNYEAKPLTREEVQEFRRSDIAMGHLLESYKLMLDFYGIRLRDETTGEVERATNWQSRFANLNSNTHNNLRITRILKCLGMLGFKKFQPPLVLFFLRETLVNGQLPAVKESVLSYFLFAVLDRRERRKLLRFAYLNYKPRHEFVWCPKKVQQRWSRPKQAGERGGAYSYSPLW